MRDDQVKLKNAGKDEGQGFHWYFLIDTCTALAPYTGATDCIEDDKVRAIMNEFIVTTKTTSQFFSEKTYIDNDYNVDSEYLIERFVLSKSLAVLNHFTVEKVTNLFSNQIYYND